MMASRKFRAVLLAVALFGVLLVGHFVLVVTGKETVAELTEASKWAMGAMGGLIATLVAAIGYEDGQAKSVGKTISAGGDVSVVQAPPGAPPAAEPSVIVVAPEDK